MTFVQTNLPGNARCATTSCTTQRTGLGYSVDTADDANAVRNSSCPIPANLLVYTLVFEHSVQYYRDYIATAGPLGSWLPFVASVNSAVL